MSVEQQVDALATSVENLKSAVVSKKATLDASVVDARSATAQAQNAKTNALSARDQAGAFKDAAYTAAQSAASAVAYQDLTALATTKDVTAVDVFIYDTSKDSDGGAWRHRCVGTSWFNEPLNTATRGARREFPAVALIVAEANRVTIYDGDDPTLPMWRVEPYAVLTIMGLAALNASISVATTVGLIVSDYVGDDLGTTAPDYTTATTPAIVDNFARDIAMMVLPDAPIDAATGLPVFEPVMQVGAVVMLQKARQMADLPLDKRMFVDQNIREPTTPGAPQPQDALHHRHGRTHEPQTPI